MSPAPSLLELQRGFRRALLGDDTAIDDLIANDGLAPADRLDVHRNNVVASLTAVLTDSFPVVCRLVDQRFLDYAADRFIRMHPPRRPCLSAYGAEFPAFLAAFPPCRHLAYLGDVARLEWAMQCAALAADTTPVRPDSLRAVPAEAAPGLTFRLQPSHSYLASPWPIDRIWRANQPGADADAAVALAAGGVRLEVRRRDGDVGMRGLRIGDFAFRAALAAGGYLAAATEAALAADDAFDPAASLAGLFADGAVAAFSLPAGGS